MPPPTFDFHKYLSTLSLSGYFDVSELTGGLVNITVRATPSGFFRPPYKRFSSVDWVSEYEILRFIFYFIHLAILTLQLDFS
jgi:hypothetical protein